MIVDKDKMAAARTKRDRLKQAKKEESCPQHQFLYCEKPHLEYTRTGYDSFAYIDRGTIKYHKCSNCGKEVGS